MMPSAQPAPDISVVVPTLNEAANVGALLSRIASTLRGQSYEVLLVDDGSPDGTREVVAKLSGQFPVRLHVRDHPSGGLSGAVLCGLSKARGEFLVVMDADLQHPPESIPDLLAPLHNGTADFVLGSRYVDGGSTESNWGRFRRLNSRIATALARPFAPGVRDPMSGFFALRNETFARARDLNPVGYKIALELMCKCRVRRVREVPIDFAARELGASKLSVRQQVRYLDHLSRLYDFYFPAASPHVKFVVGTAFAWLVSFGLYVRLVAHDVGPMFAPTLAFAGAVLATAVFHSRSLRTRRLVRARAWIDFTLLALGEWSVCTLTARWVAYHVLRASATQVFLLAFGAAAVVGYVLRRRVTHDVRGLRPIPGTQSMANVPTRKAA